MLLAARRRAWREPGEHGAGAASGHARESLVRLTSSPLGSCPLLPPQLGQRARTRRARDIADAAALSSPAQSACRRRSAPSTPPATRATMSGMEAAPKTRKTRKSISRPPSSQSRSRLQALRSSRRQSLPPRRAHPRRALPKKESKPRPTRRPTGRLPSCGWPPSRPTWSMRTASPLTTTLSSTHRGSCGRPPPSRAWMLCATKAWLARRST